MTDPNHIAEARKKVSRPHIREAFLRNGAVIPADRDDLPDYVYESVFELLEMAAPAVQGEPVVFRYRALEIDRWSYVDWRSPDSYEMNNCEFQYLSAAPQPAERAKVEGKTEWDGGGLPPVGTVCLGLSECGGEWQECEIVSHHKGSAVAVFPHGGAMASRGIRYRPHRQQEDSPCTSTA